MMPVRKAKEIIGFRYVGTSPIWILGLGELNEGDFVPLDKAKELWGDDFVGSAVLVPVEAEPSNLEKSEGGEV